VWLVMGLGDFMYTDEERKTLHQVARESIICGLKLGKPLDISPLEFSEKFRDKRATFITLKIHDVLRGCIGMLEARRSLIEDISENAFAAAFRDPRFDPLHPDELKDLEISISILTPAKNIEFSSEEDLLQKIRPGIDGLILEEGMHRGTFLPSVWEEVSDPREFLRHLKRKAGLPMDYWSDTLAIKRYTAEKI